MTKTEEYCKLENDRFREEFSQFFPTLSFEFVSGMDKIGRYGLEKHGDQSMESKFRRGDFSRDSRTEPQEIAHHAHIHMLAAIDDIPHDYFGDIDSNLFAAAFNPMIEFRHRNKK